MPEVQKTETEKGQIKHTPLPETDPLLVQYLTLTGKSYQDYLEEFTPKEAGISKADILKGRMPQSEQSSVGKKFDEAMNITPKDRARIDVYNKQRKTRRMLEWMFPNDAQTLESFDKMQPADKVKLMLQIEQQYGKGIDALVPSKPQMNDMGKSYDEKIRQLMLKDLGYREV